MTPLPVRLPDSHPISVLRDQIAPGAPDAELAYFAKVCARLDLSPFADQIVLIGRHDKRLNRDVYRPQITVAGRRALAERQPEWAGVDGPVWCGPRDARGDLVWQEVWTDDENPPYCARVLVYRHDWTVPANGTAKWSEFAQYGGRADSRYLLPLWQSMPSHMLGKCAESLALRRAFPDVIGPAVLDDERPTLEPEVPELEEAQAARPAQNSSPAPGSEPSQPGTSDQARAHALVGALKDAGEYDRFIADWQIERFGDVWPDAAVADALARFGG